MNHYLTAAVAVLAPVAAPARAQEVFAGLYTHGVDTPLTLHTGEEGVDLALGYRFAPVQGLRAVGAPAPYVIGSLNSAGDASFAGAGLSWMIGEGRLYLRPALGVVVHEGPQRRVDASRGGRTDLGSRVLFEPEIGIGYRLSERVAVEASWMHISHARLFNRDQNPGVDMIGTRVSLRLR